MNKMTYCDLSALGPRISRCYPFQLQSTKIPLTKMTKSQGVITRVKNSSLKLSVSLITDPNMTTLLLMLPFTDKI